MAHAAQHRFFENVRQAFPEFFSETRVLDCGSLDVNGSFRDLFTGGEYVGIDIAPGRGVDEVISVADFAFRLIQSGADKFDVVVSGEMLEHDENWEDDIQHMIDMTRPGGLFAFSCAGRGRPEHGTRRTGAEWGTSPDYYRNLERSDIERFFSQFSDFKCIENDVEKDLYFYGVKKA